MPQAGMMRRRTSLQAGLGLGLGGTGTGLGALLAGLLTSGCASVAPTGPAAGDLPSTELPSTELPPGPPGCNGAVPAWPAWQHFKRELLTREGRIADPRDGRYQTVSEGQAYALFFALVGNDRPSFEALLAWTERELCQGDLGAHLPAWHWGRDALGRWRVLDANAASDADLWIAYVLAQAARLWRVPALYTKAWRLARLILRHETVELSGLGLQLLPGPVGFLDRQGQARLNPSYLPLPVLRWWALHDSDPAWARLLQGSLQQLRQAAPHGLVPDWYLWPGKPSTSLPPGAHERLGGYNAIRSYLWLGLTDTQDPARAALLRQHASVCDVVEQLGDAPLSLDPDRPAARQSQALARGPRGFAAALLPLAQALGRERCVSLLRQRLEREPADPRSYYDSALALFAQGHEEGRYRFDADGDLLLPWAQCVGPSARSDPP
jgi:endoglucanase